MGSKSRKNVGSQILKIKNACYIIASEIILPSVINIPKLLILPLGIVPVIRT